MHDSDWRKDRVHRGARTCLLSLGTSLLPDTVVPFHSLHYALGYGGSTMEDEDFGTQ